MKLIIYSSVIFCIAIAFSCKKEIGKTNTTLMGYKFEVLRAGSGKQAKESDYVFFNNITIAGDSVLEDTHIFPFQPAFRLEVKPPREIAAIMDVLKEMNEGDSVRLHIPIDSLPFASIEFQSYKELTHIITLDKIITEDEYNDAMKTRSEFVRNMMDSLLRQDSIKRIELVKYIRDYNAGKLTAQLKTSPLGAKYLIIKDGTGIKPLKGDMVEVNFTGSLTNEVIFETSFTQQAPFVYRIHTGQVIKGWEDVLSQFNEGTEAIAFIPAELAYGATGRSPNIPPNSEVVFYLNLYKVRPFPKNE